MRQTILFPALIALIFFTPLNSFSQVSTRSENPQGGSVYQPKSGRFFYNFGESGRRVRFIDSGRVRIYGEVLNPYSKNIERSFRSNEMMPSLTLGMNYKQTPTGIWLQVDDKIFDLKLADVATIAEIRSVVKTAEGVLVVTADNTGAVRPFEFLAPDYRSFREIKAHRGVDIEDVKPYLGKLYLWTSAWSPRYKSVVRQVTKTGKPGPVVFETDEKVQDFAVTEKLVVIAAGFEGLKIYALGSNAEPEIYPVKKFASSVDAYQKYVVYADYSKPESSSRIYLVTEDELTQQ